MAMSSLLIGTDVTFNIKTKDQIISRFQNTILTILSKKEVHTKKSSVNALMSFVGATDSIRLLRPKMQIILSFKKSNCFCILSTIFSC